MIRWKEAAHSDFWQQLESARQSVLMLDYDGTLAPFVTDRENAVPYPGVRDKLRSLLAIPATRIMFVTGRSAVDLPSLLDLGRPVEVWGGHGCEHLDADGQLHIAEPLAHVLAGLDEGERRLRLIASADRIERKARSVALHIRGMGDMAAVSLLAEADEAWEPLVGGEESGGELEIHEFNGGLELRVSGFTKARAVEQILAEISPDTVVAYLGDDLTDEDAYAALSGRGLCVLVRSEPRPTLAAWHLYPPVELLAFLDQWERATRRV